MYFLGARVLMETNDLMGKVAYSCDTGITQHFKYTKWKTKTISKFASFIHKLHQSKVRVWQKGGYCTGTYRASLSIFDNKSFLFKIKVRCWKIWWARTCQFTPLSHHLHKKLAGHPQGPEWHGWTRPEKKFPHPLFYASEPGHWHLLYPSSISPLL